jgi:hypothetical protein
MTKRTKNLWAMALVAVAAMAVLGASTASANQTVTVYCKVLEKLCAQKNVLGPNGLTKYLDLLELTSAENVSLSGGMIEAACASSSLMGTSKTLEVEEGPRETQIDELTFSGCKVCEKVTASGLPYKAKLASDGGEMNGTMTMPATITLTNCLGTTCIFGTSGTALTVEGSKTGANLLAEKEELPRISGSELVCGKALRWTGNYQSTVYHILTLNEKNIVIKEELYSESAWVEPERAE